MTVGSRAADNPDNTESNRWLGQVFAEVFENAHYKPLLIDEISDGVVEAFAEEMDREGLFLTTRDLDDLKISWRGRVANDIRSGGFSLSEEMKKKMLARIDSAEETILANCAEHRMPAEIPLLSHRGRRVSSEHQRIIFWSEEAMRGRIPPGDAFCEFARSKIFEVRRELRSWSTEQTRDIFLNAVAQAFDAQSAYYSDKKHRRTISDISAAPTGIGLKLEPRGDGGWGVKEIVPDSPAAKAGYIEVGDTVVAVGEGEGITSATEDISTSMISDYTDGEEGGMVTLQTIPRQGGGEKKTMSFVSERLPVRGEDLVGGSIVQFRGKNIGVLRIPAFYIAPHDSHSKDRGGTDKDSLEKLRAMIAGGAEALVIDLRGDSGGTVEEAVSLAGLFMRGVVTVSKDRFGNLEEHSSPNSPVFHGPVVVLVDAGTASAAEVFAKAMQVSGRGIVVGGERTFGKSSMQNLLDLDWHGGFVFPRGVGALKITTRVFQGTDGSDIQGVGIVPDIQVPCPYDVALQIAYMEGLGEAKMVSGANSENTNREEKRAEHSAIDTQVLLRSQNRVNNNDHFTKVRRLKQDFKMLLSKPTIDTDKPDSRRAGELFSELRAIIGDTKAGKFRVEEASQMDDLKKDYHLLEGLEVGADILDLHKQHGKAGVPTKSEYSE
jgi:carboxyl-terminal processing protease